jgi:UDP-2,3-diacylglucosamine pyrophosphatase LpxH
MTFRRALVLAVVLALACAVDGHAQSPTSLPVVASPPYEAPPAGARYLVFISDLHLGIGRRNDNTWHPTEDFRWPKALAGFLDEISRRGADRVDLVVVGDFLELWQPPPEIKCIGKSAELGCTLDEMEALARLVVAEHADALDSLRAFSARGENRLHLIPGNHDATLRYERVWRPVGQALNADDGRINLVEKGIWTSPSGRIVAEHGHQIGADENRYSTWPDVLRRVDGVDYVIRPWGERFVQRLFNEQEEQYPIIDNLSPESAGIRYRMADRGIWGSAADVARFLAFNLTETSRKQLGAFLGSEGADKSEWDLSAARLKGADLFLNALDPQDPFRKELLNANAEAAAVRAALSALTADPARLPNEEVRALCDLIAANAQEKPCAAPELGAQAERKLIPRSWVMRRHLGDRLASFPRMRLFIYGHTHQYELPWAVDVGRVAVTIANTGAFQRVIDDAAFRRRLAGRTAPEALRTMSLDELPACYTLVIVEPTADEKLPTLEVFSWHMAEDGAGVLVRSGAAPCG